MLEGSLLRGEERMAQLRAQTVTANNPNNDNNNSPSSSTSPSPSTSHGLERAHPHPHPHEPEDESAPPPPPPPPPPGTSFSSLSASLTAPPRTRAEGRAQWRAFLRDRFVRGEDEDFDYAGLVDGNDEYDELERAEREEAWFDEEEPAWASSAGEEGGEDGDGDGGGRGKRVERILRGETGVQDF